MTALEAGADVVPQQFMSELYKACSGISYIDIKLFTTADAGAEPTDYPVQVRDYGPPESLHLEDMIEVDIDG